VAPPPHPPSCMLGFTLLFWDEHVFSVCGLLQSLTFSCLLHPSSALPSGCGLPPPLAALTCLDSSPRGLFLALPLPPHASPPPMAKPAASTLPALAALRAGGVTSTPTEPLWIEALLPDDSVVTLSPCGRFLRHFRPCFAGPAETPPAPVTAATTTASTVLSIEPQPRPPETFQPPLAQPVLRLSGAVCALYPAAHVPPLVTAARGHPGLLVATHALIDVAAQVRALHAARQGRAVASRATCAGVGAPAPSPFAASAAREAEAEAWELMMGERKKVSAGPRDTKRVGAGKARGGAENDWTKAEHLPANSVMVRGGVGEARGRQTLGSPGDFSRGFSDMIVTPVLFCLLCGTYSRWPLPRVICSSPTRSPQQQPHQALLVPAIRLPLSEPSYPQPAPATPRRRCSIPAPAN